MDVIQLDVPRALRRLARAPGFSATVVLSLTVGMAAVIALFGVVDTLLFREPAGLRDAGRVVAIGPWAGFERTTYPDFVDLRNESRSLESVGAFAFWSYSARIGAAVSPARNSPSQHEPRSRSSAATAETFSPIRWRRGSARHKSERALCKTPKQRGEAPAD